MASGLDPAARAAAARVAERADGPLVVAVAGRLKAGKSTVVNALLGRAVAPTDVTECTRVVTRFRRGTVERGVVVDRRGRRTPVRLSPETGLPTTLPIPEHDVAEVTVELASRALAGVEVVDTPGLSTVRDDVAAVTAGFLGLDDDSAAACARADAVLFLVNQAVRADDVDALRRFLTATGDRSGVATLGVLSKADEVDGGVPAAERLAGRMAEDLRGLAASVVPVAGLAASSCRCGRLTQGDVDALAAIAAEPEERRAMLTLDAGLFATLDAPVEADTRQRLVGLLGFGGVREALALAERTGRDAEKLRQGLLDWSGFDALAVGLDGLRRRADALKARSALGALERLAWAPTTGPADQDRLRELVASLRVSPELHVLDELAALEELAGADTGFDEQQLLELRRLLAVRDVEERLGAAPATDRAGLADLAWQGATRWQAAVNGPGTARERDIARVAQQSLLHLWAELTDGSGDDT
jgi:hypothetical protein